METNIFFGNACIEGMDRNGWFFGHFANPLGPDINSGIEVKWGVHKAGEKKPVWTMNKEATTVSILIKGRFRLKFSDRELLLEREGDYVIWSPRVPHTWVAEEESIVLSVRWPSLPTDTVELGLFSEQIVGPIE